MCFVGFILKFTCLFNFKNLKNIKNTENNSSFNKKITNVNIWFIFFIFLASVYTSLFCLLKMILFYSLLFFFLKPSNRL